MSLTTLQTHLDAIYKMLDKNKTKKINLNKAAPSIS